MTDRLYALPPIVEAGLSFEFDESATPDVQMLASLFDEISPGWESDNVFDVAGTIVPVPVASDTTLPDEHRLVGFQRRRQAERFRLIANQVQYVRMYREAPYTEWDDFIIDGMSRLRPLFGDSLPSIISGVHVRFLNELPIPKHGESYEIGDYVRMSVDIPGRLPQGVTQMFAQVDIPFERGDDVVETRAIIFAGQQTSGPVLILDLEASKEGSPGNANGLEDTMSLLRSVKNELFEGAITDACRIQMRGASE